MTYCIRIKATIDPDMAWSHLESLGCEVLFAIEENGVTDIVVKAKDPIQASFIQLCEPYNLSPIDYHLEWERHAPHFSDGYAHVPLKDGQTIKLVPGAGFGDLSHPTTRLVLDLMQEHVKDKTVIDIGSGSGILTLAAVKLGAKRAFGIDIDPEAVAHATKNASLNLLGRAQFSLPEELGSVPSPTVILMNMIFSEQIAAWTAFMKHRSLSGILITSGILEEQKREYQTFANECGWSLKNQINEEQWWGYVFQFHAKYSRE